MIERVSPARVATLPVVSPIQSLAGRRVLVATESLGPVNGVTWATAQLLGYLDAHGVGVAAVAPEWEGALPDGMPEDAPCVRLRGFPLPYNPDLRVVTPFRLHEVMRRTFRPDLVYLASPASLGLQVWQQARRTALPMVANFQTDLAHYARLSLPHAIGEAASWGADRLSALLYRDPFVRAVLCPSVMSRDYLLDLGVRTNKVHIVRRGVDSTQFDAKKRDDALRARLAPHSETLLLCVSRLSLEKGFDFLAAAYEAALRQAAAQPGCPTFRLIITGGNANPAIEESVRGFFAARDLDVQFTGMLTGEELAAMYASADVFVFPSQTETFGQVIQEAMASGLPVVAQRQGGPADLVRPGVTGHLAEPGDVDGFAQHIIHLVRHADLRTRMGYTARAIAEKRGWGAVNAQIAHIMAEALT